jgi:hypothetical protein
MTSPLLRVLHSIGGLQTAIKSRFGWGRRQSSDPKGLEVQMFDAERVLLDEFAARFHHIAHQLGKDVVGVSEIFDFYLQ